MSALKLRKPGLNCWAKTRTDILRGTPPGPSSSCRQVSWLTGQRIFPGLPGLIPVALVRKMLAAYSCGGSFG
ncbi:hypothetical protein GGR96_003319 [Thalassospira tepidiphila]|uniref:Uncharacterized protein n=1 Tax=Thalassospira tepidiphila TaxID=393657 RepID=A0ABX0X458_9PROT|nr:hypothetical protein [Thalassospira tepidiphila]